MTDSGPGVVTGVTENPTSPPTLRSKLDSVRAFSVDEAFEALAHRRRRVAIDFLRRRDGPATLSELAAEVAAREREGDGECTDGVAPERVQISLHHVHVPKLVEAGILEREGDEAVSVSEDVDQLDPIIDLIRD